MNADGWASPSAGDGVLPWLCLRPPWRSVKHNTLSLIFMNCCQSVVCGSNLSFRLCSSQKATPGNWNSCYYPWCTAGISISSLSQHDTQVKYFVLSWVLTCQLQYEQVWCHVQYYISIQYFMFITISVMILQGRESRKHPPDRAGSGQTRGLWFRLNRFSSQLLRRNSLLVRV